MDRSSKARASGLYHRWSLEMRRSRLFSAGERVGVAVSGGPDSILLLTFMRQFSAERGLCLSAVHFNHHLRGADSTEDEAFVQARAEEFGIGFCRAGADTARIARESKKNLEVAAREQRYRFFFSLIRQGKLDKVATAHTANDQAETVLLRLFRGAGIRGLGGIFPVLDGKIVRPFLEITKAEVQKEIERRSLVFRLDRSNEDPRFARNRVRRDVLPLIEREFNPAIVSLLKHMADRFRDDEAYLEEQASAAAQPWRLREGDVERIPSKPFSLFPPALQRRILRQMIAAVSPGAAVTGAHIEEVVRFTVAAPSGKALALPGGVQARKEFGWLALSRNVLKTEDFSMTLTPPAEAAIPGESPKKLKVYYENAENPGREPDKRSYNSNGAVRLDADKCGGSLVFRNWRPGDCFQAVGGSKPMKLKEIFTSRRIAVDQRQQWPVIANGNGLIWVRGLPPPRSLVASPSTARILVIEELTGRTAAGPAGVDQG